MTNFTKVTRVYTNNSDRVDFDTGLKPVYSQSFQVARDQVATMRPSNALGYPAHRSTITLKNGEKVELAETYSEILSLFA
jgi:hypothetical protein